MHEVIGNLLYCRHEHIYCDIKNFKATLLVPEHTINDMNLLIEIIKKKIEGNLYKKNRFTRVYKHYLCSVLHSIHNSDISDIIFSLCNSIVSYRHHRLMR